MAGFAATLGRLVVIGTIDFIGPDGVSATMTAFTDNASVTFAEPVQGVDILCKPGV
jgi:hypothetical protein